METSYLIRIIIVSLLYGVGSSHLFHTYLWVWFYHGLVGGLIIGVVMGDPAKGALIGAQLNTIFLGMTFYGGALPADTFIATCISVPLAITLGLEWQETLLIAIPVATLGVLIKTLIRTLHTAIWIPYVEKAVNEVNTRKIKLGSGLYPFLMAVVLSAPVVFLALYFGTGFVENVINRIPDLISTSLTSLSMILPALGFAMYIRIIGTKKTLPFFILGFFMMQFFNLSILGVAIFAFILAYITIYIDKDLMSQGV